MGVQEKENYIAWPRILLKAGDPEAGVQFVCHSLPRRLTSMLTWRMREA